jgi:hypothetical protein
VTLHHTDVHMIVVRQLPCGHSLHMKCSDDIESHADECTTEVTISVCDRKHTKTIPCNKVAAYRERNVKCQEKVTVACERNKAHTSEVECYKSFGSQSLYSPLRSQTDLRAHLQRYLRKLCEVCDSPHVYGRHKRDRITMWT